MRWIRCCQLNRPCVCDAHNRRQSPPMGIPESTARNVPQPKYDTGTGTEMGYSLTVYSLFNRSLGRNVLQITRVYECTSVAKGRSRRQHINENCERSRTRVARRRYVIIVKNESTKTAGTTILCTVKWSTARNTKRWAHTTGITATQT